MLNVRFLATSAIVGGVMAGSGFAAPGVTTKWISEDSASMMDLGLLRLDLWLSDHAEFLKTTSMSQVEVYHTYSAFNWEDDEISVRASLYLQTAEASAAEAECRRFLSRVRIYAGVDLETGGIGLRAENYSRISELFQHEGFDRLKAPSDLYAKLDQRIVIRCDILNGNGTGFVPFLQVSGKLLSSTFATTVY